MNYHMPYYGNLPHGVTQAAIDKVFGRAHSERACDAMETHAKVQTLRMQLRSFLAANSDVLGFDTYEDLIASLDDAEMGGTKIETVVLDAEQNDSDGEMFDRSDEEYERRRDEEDRSL